MTDKTPDPAHTELLPCPFCGSNNIHGQSGPSSCWYSCGECGMSGPECTEDCTGDNHCASTEMWNERYKFPPCLKCGAAVGDQNSCLCEACGEQAEAALYPDKGGMTYGEMDESGCGLDTPAFLRDKCPHQPAPEIAKAVSELEYGLSIKDLNKGYVEITPKSAQVLIDASRHASTTGGQTTKVQPQNNPNLSCDLEKRGDALDATNINWKQAAFSLADKTLDQGSYNWTPLEWLENMKAALQQERVPNNEWKLIDDQFIKGKRNGKGSFLVTNSINARNAHGLMSHVWCDFLVHKNPKGDVGLEGLYYVLGGPYSLTHWREINEQPPTEAALEGGEE